MTQQPAGLDALFTIVPLIIAVGFVVVIGTAIYRFVAARRAGFDPIAGDIQLAAKARDSQLLAAERTTDERLAEVDGLLAAGRISPEEHKAARARILGDV